MKILFSFLVFLSFAALGQDQTNLDYYRTKLKESPENTNLLNGLAWEFVTSYVDSTLFYNEKAIVISHKNLDSVSLANSYYIKGVALEIKGITKASKASFLTSMFYSRKMGMTERYNYTLNSLAAIFIDAGEIDSAMYYYEKCLITLKKFDDQGAIASVLYNIGSLYESSGNYAQATTKYFESLTIRETYDDSAKVALCLIAIGTVYEKQKKPQLASLYYHKALKRTDTKVDQLTTGIIYANLASLYLQTNLLDSASFYIDKKVKLSRSLNDPQALAFADLLKAELAIKRQNPKLALLLSKKCADYYENFNQKDNTLKAKVIQLEALHLLNRNTEAKSLGEYLLVDYNLLRSKNLFSKIHHQLMIINENLQDYKSALTHEKIYQLYQDSIYNVALAGELADLRTKYESEKNGRTIDNINKEKELQGQELSKSKNRSLILIIALLFVSITSFLFWKLYRKKNKISLELEEKNEAIETALIERELLLKEIHHRVKNNLQIISSLLNIQSGNQFSAADVIKTSQDRIQAMAMIHEKLYQSGNFNELNSKDYIENLVDQYRMAYQSDGSFPTFKTKLSSIVLSLDKLIPIGLIINECITNTIKYAFNKSDQGEVLISINEHEKEVTLSIYDNGSGFDASKPAASLGIRLIEGLAGQLNGTMNLSATNGTRFDISFPN